MAPALPPSLGREFKLWATFHASLRLMTQADLRQREVYAARGFLMSHAPKWPKSKVGLWLLISLLPATGIFIIIIIIAAVNEPDEPTATWGIIVVLSSLYWVCAFVAGVILTVWSGIERRRTYREARRYAEAHGWLPISKTSWRNRKPENVRLAVDQSFEKPTYILTIVVRSEATSVEEFETAHWALQFGDWLWEQLLKARGARVDRNMVSEKRDEWEETRAMAVYKPSTPAHKPWRPDQEAGVGVSAAMVSGHYAMQGRILRFSVRDGGIISGDDGQRYRFDGSAWISAGTPTAGQRVDFDALEDGRAADIIVVSGAATGGSKSKVVAGMFAFFLGGFGGHKFYLGHPGLGILYIGLSITLVGGLFFTAPVSLIEAILYWTKSDEEFERVYVQERKAWF